MALINYSPTNHEQQSRLHDGVDHIVLVVRSLGPACTLLQRLGFALTATNGHPTLGTVHRLVQLRDSYLEVLAIARPGPSLSALAASLETGRDLCRLALHSRDADHSAAILLNRSVPVSEVMRFRRPISGDEPERGMLGFRVVIPEWQAFDGLPVFFCEHENRALTIPLQPVHHPNGAVRISGLEASVPDPSKSVKCLHHLLDASLTGQTMCLRDVLVTFVAPRDGGAAAWTGVTVEVVDLAACRELLRAHGVRLASDGPTLLVEPSPELPVSIRFASAAQNG